MNLLTEPLTYTFFTRALVTGIIVGGLCGAIGVFVVLRRMSYIGHGLAHSVVGGVAVAMALDLGIYWGAAAATLLSAVLIDRITRRHGLHADAAIGIVTTAMFAAGVVVISVARSVRVNLESLMFGTILGLTRGDVLLAAAVAVGAALLLLRSYKPLVSLLFDPTVASAQGVRTSAGEAAFNILVCAVVIAGVRLIGVLLIAAAVVVPAAVARVLCTSINHMVVLAAGAGATASVIGLYGSYHLDVPSGPAIVLTGTALFVVAASGTSLGTARRRRRARRRVGAGV